MLPSAALDQRERGGHATQMSRTPIEGLEKGRDPSDNLEFSLASEFRTLRLEFIAMLGFWVVAIAGLYLGTALGDWTGYAFMAIGFIIVWRGYSRRADKRRKH